MKVLSDSWMRDYCICDLAIIVKPVFLAQSSHNASRISRPSCFRPCLLCMYVVQDTYQPTTSIRGDNWFRRKKFRISRLYQFTHWTPTINSGQFLIRTTRREHFRSEEWRAWPMLVLSQEDDRRCPEYCDGNGYIWHVTWGGFILSVSGVFRFLWCWRRPCLRPPQLRSPFRLSRLIPRTNHLSAPWKTEATILPNWPAAHVKHGNVNATKRYLGARNASSMFIPTVFIATRTLGWI